MDIDIAFTKDELKAIIQAYYASKFILTQTEIDKKVLNRIRTAWEWLEEDSDD